MTAAVEARDFLLRQLGTAWALARFHLDGLGTEEMLWRPASRGLHVCKRADGQWHADWPEHEGYELGPASIAWITWHMIFWWSMLLDHTFGPATLDRERVTWPGDADAVRERLVRLHDDWRTSVEHLAARDLAARSHTRWPFKERPFGDVVAWANIELVKNASEIGYARFLYAMRDAR